MDLLRWTQKPRETRVCVCFRVPWLQSFVFGVWQRWTSHFLLLMFNSFGFGFGLVTSRQTP